MPRLFSALELSDEARYYLSQLRTKMLGARWIEPTDYHITLCFFGNTPQGTARDLCELLDIPGSGMPLTIHLKQLDVFGGDTPRSLVALADLSEALQSLHKRHERAARSLGLYQDRYKFTPHVTLARLDRVTPLMAAESLSQLGFFRPLHFEIQQWGLFSSHPSRGGGPYIKEESFAL